MVVGISFIDVGNTVLGILGLLVGVFAIPFGIREGRKQIKKMGEMRERLEAAITDLKGDVETHYIGDFPEFIPRIVEILGEATREIKVFCDMPAYGVVSDPRGFRRYARTIEEKAEEGIPVRMLHLNGPGRAATREIEFGDPWEELGQEERVIAFLKKSREELDGGDPRSDFLAMVERRQVSALRSFEEAGVDADQTDLIMPLYFWIIDGRKAVFALTEFGEKAREAGFWTRSEKLIKAMEGIFKRYYDSRTEEARGGEGAAAVI
jgi:hypothetical protein